MFSRSNMIIGRSQDGINLSQREHPTIARRFNAGNAKGVPSLSPGLRGSATLGARPPALNPERVASVPHSCTIFLSPLQLRQNRPERPSHDSLGQRPGYGAMMAIKRCKRATTPALLETWRSNPPSWFEQRLLKNYAERNDPTLNPAPPGQHNGNENNLNVRHQG